MLSCSSHAPLLLDATHQQHSVSTPSAALCWHPIGDLIIVDWTGRYITENSGPALGGEFTAVDGTKLPPPEMAYKMGSAVRYDVGSMWYCTSVRTATVV